MQAGSSKCTRAGPGGGERRNSFADFPSLVEVASIEHQALRAYIGVVCMHEINLRNLEGDASIRPKRDAHLASWWQRISYLCMRK